MTAAWNPKANELFLKALEISSPSKRQDYLDSVCAGDLGLRVEVEALLDANSRAGSFLESPVPAVVETVVHSVAESPATIIGPYKLIEQIGEGGMGTVWMAQQQEPVKRVVALKVIKAGMDSKQVIARFEAERQALALMDHANIARVLDAGTTSAGRPYFVMDLVKGVPITKYCDDHRLTTRQRLELFIPVCQAVQHAHQKGIIHRDLKPSNVLVAHYDGKPVPKVIDFGVAKAAGQALTDKTLVTGFGAILGTPEYMSPEQAEINQLDIDTRSDIYSLGVLLYELLAGSPPFSKSDLEKVGMLEMLRVIREQEPSKPSTKLSSSDALPSLSANRGTEPAKLTKLMRGELDWIVMKALEKDRNRRYETANGFAMDVQRYLADETVQACPPTLGYRLRKFMRRNRGPVVAASVVILALVGGIIGTTWGMLRARMAEANAAREADEKTVALTEAKTNLEDAMAAVDQLLTRLGDERLAEVPQMETIRRELLQDALKFYQKFLARKSNDTVIRWETARCYWRMGRLYFYLGQLSDANEAFPKAIAMMEELGAPTSRDPGERTELVCTLIDHGWAVQSNADQVRQRRRAVEVAQSLVADFGDLPDSRETWLTARICLANALIGSQPDEAERILKETLRLVNDHERLGQTYVNLGLLCRSNQRWPEAEKHFRHAVEQREKRLAEAPEEIWPRRALALALRDLAYALAVNQHLAEAESYSRRAIPITDRLARDYPKTLLFRQEHAMAEMEHAGLLKQLGQTPEAEKAYRRAADLYEKLADDFPWIPTLRQGAFDQRITLSQFLVQGGRPLEAQEVLGKATTLSEKLAVEQRATASHRYLLARCRFDLGVLQQQSGQADAAERNLRQAVELWTELTKLNPGDWPSLHMRGLAYFHLQDLDKAVADQTKAIELNPSVYGLWHHRGVAYAALKEWAKAVADQTEAIKLSPTLWGNWHQRGLCHSQLKQWDAALSDFMKVVELEPNQALGVVQHLQTAMRSEEADKLLRHRIGVLEKAVPDAANLQNLGQCSRLMAQLLEKSDRQQDREAYLNRAIDAFAKLAKEQPATANHRDLLARSQFELGVHQWQTGQTDAAELNMRQAMELWTKLAAEVPAESVYLQHAVRTFLYSLAPLLQENGRALVAEQLLAGAMPEWAKLARNDREDHRNLLADATGLWARLLYDLGKRQQAEELAAKVVEQWPDNVSALIARGRIRMALKEPDKALEDFEKAILLAPKDGVSPWWWLDRSNAHVALNQGDKALAVLTEATERWPNLWDAWMWRGWFYFQRNRFRDAVADYSKAATLNPRQWTCWQALGTTSVRLAEWDRAIEAYEKAMALQPKNAGLQHELAWLLAHCPDEKVRNPKRAVELARRAVGLYSKNGLYRGALGSALYRAGDWKVAIEELNASIKLRGRHGADMLFLAMAHKRLEQDAEARTWLDRAIEWIEMNAPKDDELRRFRDEATVLLELKD